MKVQGRTSAKHLESSEKMEGCALLSCIGTQWSSTVWAKPTHRFQWWPHKLLFSVVLHNLLLSVVGVINYCFHWWAHKVLTVLDGGVIRIHKLVVYKLDGQWWLSCDNKTTAVCNIVMVYNVEVTKYWYLPCPQTTNTRHSVRDHYTK